MYIPEVEEILEVLCQRIPVLLGDNLEGLYVKGSLVLGDFNPETSDVDLLVVVKQALGSANFEQLDAMHREIQTLPNRYAHEVELAYVPAAKLNHFVPGERYPSLERGEQLKWKALASNWILDFWIARERGFILIGPDPKTLIDPISAEQMVAAVRGVMPDWLEWVNSPDDPGWHGTTGTLRFAVETMCRVLYTLEFAQMCSKPTAVRWALQTLPEPWVLLIQESQGWWSQKSNPKDVSRVWAFVRWVAAKVG